MIAFDKQFQQHTQDEGVELMLRLQAGDDSALGDLSTKYSSLIACIVVEHLGSDQSVEDVIQDVLIRVLQARDRYEPTAKLSTWIAVITRNIVLNLKRNQFRRGTYAVDFSDICEGASSGFGHMPHPYQVDDPLGRLVSMERSQRVRDAVARLIPRQRQAITLVYFKGMSYAEAASTMRLTPMAIKSILVRALELASVGWSKSVGSPHNATETSLRSLRLAFRR